MEGKLAPEEHFSTPMNNGLWDAKGEESRNGVAYSRDVERRLTEAQMCLMEMDRAGIEMCILSLTSPGVAAAEELERAVVELGMRGVLVNGYSNLGPNEQVQYLDEAPLREFWGEGLPFMRPGLQHRLDEQREGEKGAGARRRPSYYFAQNFYITTSGHFHPKPVLECIDQIGAERILFSVDYPYEQMDSAGRWFDDLRLENGIKHKIGRENANRLFSMKLAPVPESLVAGFGS